MASAQQRGGTHCKYALIDDKELYLTIAYQQCSACRDRTHILPCSTQGCAVGLCCTANLSEHGCVDLGSFLDSVRETDPEVRAVLGARTSIDTVHSLATLGETSRGLDKLYKIICQQRLFVCPFCLASKGEAVPVSVSTP